MKPDITAPLINAALAERYSAFTLHPLTEGDDSIAFRVETDSGRRVLRLNSSRLGFDKDKWASEVLADIVPTASILEIFALADVWACVSSHIAGVPFQRAPQIDLPHLAPAVAEVLALIGRQTVSGSSGYGRIDAAGNGTQPSWRDFLRLPLMQTWAECSGDPVFSQALALLERLSTRAPETRSLVHGDFGGGNVLVEGRRVTGMIDWSEALYGDPLYDIANVHFWRPWLKCLDTLASHIDATSHVDPVLLRLYQLRIGVENMRDYARSGDRDSLSWVRNRTAEFVTSVVA